MEMRAGEKVEIGSDLTPAVAPISYALHDAFLRSHCSSCFSPLPDPPFLPSGDHRLSASSFVFYCSSLCSSADSPIHFSSAESHLLTSSPPPTADLRAALRLLLLRSASFSPSDYRMLGLLTNRESLLAEDDEISDRVRTGSRAMMAARDGEEIRESAEEEEAALCLVITNGVEVLDSRSRPIGIAVYDSAFSWINHSCSPNSCYRFLFSPPGESPHRSLQPSSSLLVPSGTAAIVNHGGGFGPRIAVRSIRRIENGEAVTVAYTDLFQPKAVRQSELWLKYRFICSCPRCSSSPSSYVDHALEDVSSRIFDKAEANERLADYVDGVVSSFLSDGEPEPCCRKLERLLLADRPDAEFALRLNPLHHLSLNAYTALASAYRVHAVSLSDPHSSEFFDKSRTSVAYALFLAAQANHLFRFEPSLIASVANYWASTGESLLKLVGTSSLPFECQCSKCGFVDVCRDMARNADFMAISFGFVDCIGSYVRRLWSCLSRGCEFLSRFDDPMDFGSNRKCVNSSCDATRESFDLIPECGFTDQEMMDLLQLGAHCMVYGGFLSAICYGDQSPWTNQIQYFVPVVTQGD